jgi:ABC-type antimicrobial peptide transport system permease subunit
MATVLLRNVLERRQELALLRAVGFRRPVLSIIILAENIFLIVWGLASGVLCALVAILPAIHERGTELPFGRIALIVLMVFAAGTVSSLFAAIAAHRAPLLTSLRSE